MIEINQKLNIFSTYYLTVIDYIRKQGGEARLIGGIVRDAIIGKYNHDIDICTNLSPSIIIDIFTQKKAKVITLAQRFGTITIKFKTEKFEITTLRRDYNYNGRYSKVIFTKSFKLDAQRRDFTINAISYCPFQEKLYDYFNGINHLRQRKVIFIGDPEQRIKEDYLRILRFFRFSAKYADSIDKEGLKACIKLKNGLSILSQERIKSELDLLLIQENAIDFLSIMDNSNILQQILKPINYNINYIKAAIKFSHTTKNKINLTTIYAILFINNDNLSKKSLNQFGFSKKDNYLICKLRIMHNYNSSDKDKIKGFLLSKWIDENEWCQYFIYAAIFFKMTDTILDLISNLENKEKPKFPISAADIIELGYKKEKIGQTLLWLKNEWINNNFNKDKKELILLAKKNIIQ